MKKSRCGFWQRNVLLQAALVVVFGARLGGAASALDEPDFDALSEEGLEILTRYLQIDTSNPPGNELEAAVFLGRLLEEEGIPYQILEAAPGRANVYARLEGKGSEGALVLLHHMDVVPADESFWSFPPFGGEVKDGHILGRGSVDMKGLGVIQLLTFLELARGDYALSRDVVLLATGDEESGSGVGTTWVLDNHSELVEGAEFVLNEGGSNLEDSGDFLYVGVEVAEKVPLWLRMTVQGHSGHGSMPAQHNAAVHLVEALERVLNLENPPRVEPVVGQFLKQIAPFQPEEIEQILSPEDGTLDPVRVATLSPYYYSLVTNTINLTVLSAGSKTSVIPAVAFAELDCRLLPSQDPTEFVNLVAEAADDPAVQLETLLSFRSTSSPPESVVLDAIREVTSRMSPETKVGISVLPGFTDSHLFRERGIAAYGFSPFRIGEWDETGVHGVDERLPVEEFSFGIRYYFWVVAELVL